MTESEETLSLKMNIYGILHGHFIFLLNKVYRFSVYFGDSDGKESAYNAGDPGSFPGSGRSLGEGNGYQLQYSCLENFMERSLHRVGHDWATNIFHFSLCLIYGRTSPFA